MVRVSSPSKLWSREVSDSERYRPAPLIPQWAAVLLNMTGDTVLLLSQTGVVRGASGSAIGLLGRGLGLQRTELPELIEGQLPQEAYDCLAAERPEWTGRLCFRHTTVGTPIPAHLTLRRAQDEPRWFLASVNPITAHHHLDQHLFDHVLLPLILHDASGRIRQVNKATCSLFSCVSEDLIGKRAADLHPKTGPYAPPSFSLPVGGSFSFSTRLIRKDQRDIPVEVHVVKFHQDGEDLVLGSLRDLSREDLLLTRLVQTQQLELMSRLSGGLAHDLNNLLMIIINNSSMLQEEFERVAADPEMTEIAQDLGAAAERAGDLTKQLLDVVRVRSNERRAVDLNELIGGMERVLGAAIGAKATLKTELADTIPTIMADPGQLMQLVANLVMNARDAMTQAGQITVRTTVIWTSGAERCVLEVEDTGPGIPDHVVPHIFEQMFTTKGQSGGTGLGLGSVQDIVTAHGASIDLFTEVGVGTRFRIDFPVSYQDDDESIFPHRLNDKSPESRCVLVVDDLDAIRAILQRILAREGMKVEQATDGIEALKRLRDPSKPAVSLLITDLLMPAMNGRDLCRTVVAEQPDLPIIVLSAYSADLMFDDMARTNIRFLSKPIRPSKLVPLVKRLMVDPPSGS